MFQDDYLDCYADPEVLGKIGTDIEDRKCSWLAVQALLRSNPSQRRRFEENYGKKDRQAVAAIKALYREMDLERVYEEYEAKVYKSLNEKIAKVQNVPRMVFVSFLDRIFKRKK